MNTVYEQASDLYQKLVGEYMTMAFATTDQNQVTVRTMSMIQKEGKLYCTAFGDSTKCAQIASNPQVALSFDATQILGQAKVIADLSTPFAKEVLAAVEAAYPRRAKYSSAPGCVLIEVAPQTARFYDSSATPPAGFSIDFDKKTAVDLMK